MTTFVEKIIQPINDWYQTSAVKAFWEWWSAAMLEWVPEEKRLQLFPKKEQIFITPQGEGAQLWCAEDGAVTMMPEDPDLVESNWWHQINHHLGASELSAEVKFLIPEQEVLVREVALPAAAAANVSAVLQYELDKYIPYDPKDVVFAYQKLPVEEGAEKLPIQLVVVHRDTVTNIQEDINQKGVQLSAIDVNVGESNSPCALGVNLLDESMRRKKDWTQIRLNILLLISVVGLIWFLMYQSIENKELKIQRLEALTDDLRAQARRAKLLETQLNESVMAANFLGNKQIEVKGPVGFIHELTQLIPANSYLTRVILDQDKIEVVGQSDNANALVPILNQSTLWHEPTIIGQVMPDARTGKEKFTIKANLKIEEEGSNES